ncbi:MAG: hypothetical protein V2A55_03095 [Candidatus Jorgensenbacteria bacterium]
MKRFFKQFIYGIGYLAVFALVLFAIYSAVFKAPEEIIVPNPLVPEIPAPNLDFENVKTEVSGDEVRVTGNLKNKSPQVVRNVKIEATLLSKEGVEIYSSETLEERIGAFESEPFTVFFPEDQGIAEDVWGESTEVSFKLQ